jgi:hypothetical protein
MLRDAASSSGMRSVPIFDSTSPNLSYIGWRIFIRPSPKPKTQEAERRANRSLPRCAGTEVRQHVSEIAALRAHFAPALVCRAADLAAGGKAGDLVDWLLKGTRVMQGSGNLYPTWTSHYAALGTRRPRRPKKLEPCGGGGNN